MEAACRDAGFDVEEISASYVKPPIGNGVLLLVWLALGWFFGGFFGSMGADAWKGLKSGIEKIRASRERPEIVGNVDYRATVHVVLEDASHVRLVFYEDLPDEAYQRALEIDWSHYERAEFVWEDGDWRDMGWYDER